MDNNGRECVGSVGSVGINSRNIYIYYYYTGLPFKVIFKDNFFDIFE